MPNQTAIRFGYPETLIKEYGHWVVLLREPQPTLGSLILCAKADVTEFSALPAGAFAEMSTVTGDIERALKAAFDQRSAIDPELALESDADPEVEISASPTESEQSEPAPEQPEPTPAQTQPESEPASEQPEQPEPTPEPQKRQPHPAFEELEPEVELVLVEPEARDEPGMSSSEGPENSTGVWAAKNALQPIAG